MKRSDDGIIDVPRNSCNITTVEAEFDRAMKAAGEAERKNPVGHAIGELVHYFKHNRFNFGYSYGDLLQFYMTQPQWKEIESLMPSKSLPNMYEFESLRQEYVMKLYIDCIRTHPKIAKTKPWYAMAKAQMDAMAM